MAQIKSKERVRDLAEVYTNEREVNAMLDLIPLKKPDDIISYRYLEPACGNGNFLIEILRRKLNRVNEKYSDSYLTKYEFYIARALTTIYGIDICPENVKASRERLFKEIELTFHKHKSGKTPPPDFLKLCNYILETNIVLGDSINAAEKIEFTEFKVRGKYFTRRTFIFSDLTQDKPLPIKEEPEKYFLRIGEEYESKTGIAYEGK
jgi:hypothetical protein